MATPDYSEAFAAWLESVDLVNLDLDQLDQLEPAPVVPAGFEVDVRAWLAVMVVWALAWYTFVAVAIWLAVR